ncbi:MAG: hypothetical protein ACTHLL_06025 [Candidatus Nitrosocosmicus sp.]
MIAERGPDINHIRSAIACRFPASLGSSPTAIPATPKIEKRIVNRLFLKTRCIG